MNFEKLVYSMMDDLKNDVKNAFCIELGSQEEFDTLAKILEDESNCTHDGSDCPYEIRLHFDEHKLNTVWLYKYESIGLLIAGLYGLPYSEHVVLSRFILGESAKELNDWYMNDDNFDDDSFDYYSDNYYKPIHPWHCTYDRLKFDFDNRDYQAPYTHAKYWEDIGNPNKPEFIED